MDQLDELQNLDMIVKRTCRFSALTGAQPLDPTEEMDELYLVPWVGHGRSNNRTPVTAVSFLSPHRNLLSTQIAATGAALWMPQGQANHHQLLGRLPL
jgi:hypothetical protein